MNAYKTAYLHALAVLESGHPTRLGLALNFAVFYHGARLSVVLLPLGMLTLPFRLDVRQSPERACHLAKSALDDAVASFKRDASGACLMDSTTRDSLMILQLLRDDLLLWSAEMADGMRRPSTFDSR